MKKFLIGLVIGALLSLPIVTLSAPSFIEKLKGKILLATEDKGKTYYVANDGYRYRITVATAQKVFEKLAIGITNSNLAKIPEKDLGIVSEAAGGGNGGSSAPSLFSITYIAGQNGSITGINYQTSSKGSVTAPVTAIPNSGFRFVNWSDGATANPRTDIISVNTSYTANFTANVFSCGQNFLDSRDSQLYPTAQIGTQCWFAKNLAYLPFVNPANSVDLNTAHYYVYNYKGSDVNIAKSQTTYKLGGVYYNYVAALTACPSGWHLPSDSEWTNLSYYLDWEVAGGKLKATRTSGSIIWDGTNESSFNALPVGMCGVSCINWGIDTSFFSTWEDGANNSVWYLYDNSSSISQKFYMNKSWGRSVRCLKD